MRTLYFLRKTQAGRDTAPDSEGGRGIQLRKGPRRSTSVGHWARTQGRRGAAWEETARRRLLIPASPFIPLPTLPIFLLGPSSTVCRGSARLDRMRGPPLLQPTASKIALKWVRGPIDNQNTFCSRTSQQNGPKKAPRWLKKTPNGSPVDGSAHLLRLNRRRCHRILPHIPLSSPLLLSSFSPLPSLPSNTLPEVHKKIRASVGPPRKDA